MIDSHLPVLCIVPSDFLVQPDWTSIGCEAGQPRGLCACLANIHTYSADGPTPIFDWPAARRDYGIMVEDLLTVPELTGILDELVPQGRGLFVLSGGLLSDGVPRPDPIQHVGHRFDYKTCMAFPGCAYIGSRGAILADLWGAETVANSLIAYYPSGDTVAEHVIGRYETWPDSDCGPMLPNGPSPSRRSVELTLVGDEGEFTGLFVSDDMQESITPARLRKILGEDAILATVETDDFWHWLDFCNVDELLPIDRPLPFRS